MKLGIMQPYFLPYIGYVSLMKYVDRWVFLDVVQMIERGWIHRNRVLKQHEGWYYINVPLVKHHYTTPILDVRIRNEEPWKEKILTKLTHYKKKAPFYKQTINLLTDSFRKEFDTITHQNAHLLKNICDYIGFEFTYDIFSEMDLKIEPVHASDEWALVISKALGIDHYTNPILGKTFFETTKYEDADISINFLKKNIDPYDQKNASGKFIDDLSIVDVMMFNSPEEIMKILDDYDLE